MVDFGRCESSHGVIMTLIIYHFSNGLYGGQLRLFFYNNYIFEVFDVQTFLFINLIIIQIL